MIKHVIIWTLKDTLSESEKETVKKEAKCALEALNGNIDGLIDIKLNIKEEYLKNIQFNEDGTVLTANVTPENAVEVLGTDIRAVDDITLVVETNGVNLTLVTISCTTSIGDLAIRTSYTYNAQDLFPESDAQ